ncbi:MAG: zinc-finger domain-containing protein [Pseudomonadota bacterium]
MAKAIVPHFHNDAGVPVITIGVKEFMCVGASAPYDHPHVYLDMGEDGEKVCPYCSTLYRFDASLAADETEPVGCLVDTETTNVGIDMKAAPIAESAV